MDPLWKKSPDDVIIHIISYLQPYEYVTISTYYRSLAHPYIAASKCIWRSYKYNKIRLLNMRSHQSSIAIHILFMPMENKVRLYRRMVKYNVCNSICIVRSNLSSLNITTFLRHYNNMIKCISYRHLLLLSSG